MDDIYFFHQTPHALAAQLVASLQLEPTDRLYEPFRGEGAFYDAFPAENPKDWSEICKGRDFKDYTGEYDWVITNPPFRLATNGRRVNTFWYLLDYYTQRAQKGVAFLSNNKCFCALTPARIKGLAERGWYLKSLQVCSVKKWRGRYFFIVLTHEPSNLLTPILGTF